MAIEKGRSKTDQVAFLTVEEELEGADWMLIFQLEYYKSNKAKHNWYLKLGRCPSEDGEDMDKSKKYLGDKLNNQ